MDEDGDVYENCAPSYETQIRTTAFNSREEKRYEDPISSRYIGASSQRGQANSKVQDENITLKNVSTADSSGKQASHFTTRVMLIILVVATLLNTTMCVWLAISFQRAGLLSSSTKSHLPSAQSSIGGRLGQNQELLSVNRTLSNHETMLQNISKAIKLNAEAIASVERNLAEILNTSLLISGSVSKITNVCSNLTTNPVTKYQNLLNAISAVSTPSGFVRLVDGPNRYSGRVEIYYNGVWGTICDDDWDIDDARVICRMLGYGGASSAPGSAKYGRGYGSILLDDVHCSGTESSIVQCSKSSWHHNDCGHIEDASVVCA